MSDMVLEADHTGDDSDRKVFADAVIAGLSQAQKSLPTAYLYDRRGSELFEDITELHEYYQTRTEIAILEACAADWVGGLPDGTTLVEFGSGSSRKTEILLSVGERIAGYAPIDVSPSALNGAVQRLRKRFSSILVTPLVGDFNTVKLPAQLAARPKAGFFPGSTIGNFAPQDSVALLRVFARLLGGGSSFLIGVDLRKERRRLVAAYDDAKGVTAEFNLNLLRRINRELNADFDLSAFRHLALYNEDEGRIEMHLVSGRSQKVKVAGRTFTFREGETIHTENSYKYTREGFAELAAQGGWRVSEVWTDPEELFSVQAMTAQA